MLTTWDQRARRDKITITQHQLPGADDAARICYERFERRDHAADQGAALLPHHEPDRASSSRCSDSARMARARGIITIVDGAHAVRAFPVQAARPRDGLLRHQPAQVAARADRHRACSTCAAIASPRRGRCRPRPSAATTTSASSRKSARRPAATKRRDQRGAGVPPGDRHRAQGRAAALPDAALGEQAEERVRASRCTRASKPGQTWGLACVVHRRRRTRDKLVTHLWDKYRIVIAGIGPREPEGAVDDYRGHARDAEHLHAARGSGLLRRGHARRRQERCLPS